MSTATQQVVSKAWNFAHVLRDDGLSYMSYIEQITFLLFLKMADEQTKPPFNRPAIVPSGLDWATLQRLDGDALDVQYRHTLVELGKQSGTLGVIFRKAQNKIQDPAKLKRLVSDLIDKEQWMSLDADVKGDAYEGLLTDEAIASGEEAFAKMLDDTRVDGLIEFTRSTHAEMAALLDASRRGVSVHGATLYTSTFPCHNCAKHIITAGIAKVVFIEPYPKSLAEQLHSDALAVDDPTAATKVRFEHFTGVAPVNYFTLFKATEERKTSDGAPVSFSAETIRPKLRGNFHATPLQFEQGAIEQLAKLRDKNGSPTAEMLDDAPIVDAHRPSTSVTTVDSEPIGPARSADADEPDGTGERSGRSEEDKP